MIPIHPDVECGGSTIHLAWGVTLENKETGGTMPTRYPPRLFGCEGKNDNLLKKLAPKYGDGKNGGLLGALHDRKITVKEYHELQEHIHQMWN